MTDVEQNDADRTNELDSKTEDDTKIITANILIPSHFTTTNTTIGSSSNTEPLNSNANYNYSGIDFSGFYQFYK